MHRYFEINEGGLNIRCKLYCRREASIRRVVIFGHGFGGHKDNGAAENFALRMNDIYEDTALVTFNWPAHGDDESKNLALDACMDYLALVTEYARLRLGAEELYSYATSFGGYLTLKYIHERGNPFRRIALRCPAVNMYHVLTDTIMSSEELALVKGGKTVPVGFDRKIAVDPSLLEELLRHDIQALDFTDLAEKILIIHGTTDEVVPFAAARAFAESNNIRFVPSEGADHRFQAADRMEQAISLILDFYGF